jgi:hypothetical protein
MFNDYCAETGSGGGFEKCAALEGLLHNAFLQSSCAVEKGFLSTIQPGGGDP